MKYVFKEKETMRLNAYLAYIGVASRRQADTLIEKGKIKVNGSIAKLGMKLSLNDIIETENREGKYTYLLYNKPRGEITGPLPSHPKLHPLGRLDKESEGLLMYTDDYRLNEALLNPKYGHEREYVVTVREQMTPRVERLLMSGIKTQEATYKKAVRVVLSPNRHTVHITLSEGKKHEIRRMLNALNLTITSLKRIRILFLTLGTLKPGQTRELTEKDRLHLLAVLSSLTRQ
jgi:pseudouridine synthase